MHFVARSDIGRPGQKMFSMPISECLFCDHPNPASAKFCNECGSPLHLKPCKQCDAINAAASNACYKCGALFPVRASASGPAAATWPTQAEDTVANPDTSAERFPVRRATMATVLPVIVLCAIATSAYIIGYRQTGPLQEWLHTAWAAVSPNRGVVAIPEPPATTSVSPSGVPATDVETTNVAAAKPASLPATSAAPTDITTAPPSQESVPATGGASGANSTPPPMQAKAPMTSPPPAATPEHATAATTAPRAEKKSPSGARTPAKKSKSTKTRKPAPTQTRPAS